MSKGDFSSITKKAKPDLDSFISGAKVDGEHSTDPLAGLDPNARRGKYHKDKDTGKRIELGGKVQEIPLNAYELTILETAAKQENLSLTTFMRKVALDFAKAQK